MNLDLILYHTSKSAQWIKELAMRPEMIKLPEGKIGYKLLYIDVGNIFLYYTKSQDNKTKNKQMGKHQTKKLCTEKETINKIKSKLQYERKYI